MRYDAAYFRPHVWNRMLLCKPHWRFKKVSPKTSGGLAHLCRFVSTGHGVYCVMLRFSIKPIDAKITPHKQCSPERNSVPASKQSKEVNDTEVSMCPKSQSDVFVPKPCRNCD